MERERFLTNDMNWNYSNFGMEIQSNDFNNNNSCIFNPKWDNSMDQSDPFESAVSSIVSSPAASNGGGGPTTTTPITGDSIMIRELIGRLGSICNSGEISPQPYIPGNNSTNTSCYNTPLNSPPKLNLSMMDPQMRPNLPLSGTHLAPFPADPGFAERAARFSCFGTRNVGQFSLVETELGCCNNRSMPKSESGKLSRVSSNQSFKFATGSGSQMGNLESNAKGEENGVELNDSREGSSVSEQVTFGELNIKTEPVPPAAACNNRKRKSITKGKGKEAATNPKDVKAGVESDELKAKRSKQEAENGTEKGSEKGEECCDGENKNGGEGNDNQKTCNYKDNLKPPEPPKDYIHVRARRGQATDSHSLAERVRREKISERMKFLQDLVPGCNKVIGKAVMLDEIINYVQSLQRQVEFLSMKLATVNPRMDFNMETLLPKEVFQTRGSLPQTMYPLDSSMPGFSNNYQALQLPSPQLHNNGISTGNENQFSVNPAMSGTLRRNLSTHGPPPIDGFAEAVPSQVSSFWEDDLQSVVQMGYGQN